MSHYTLHANPNTTTQVPQKLYGCRDVVEEAERIDLNQLSRRKAGDFTKLTDGNYWSADPRLVVASTGQRLVLDRPPETSNTPLNQVATAEVRTSGYRHIGDIEAGDEQFYIQKDRAAAYTHPNFIIPSDVHPTMFVDPMGGRKPTYQRTQRLDQVQFYTQEEQDIMSLREHIMSAQMRIRNRESWGAVNGLAL